MKTAIFTSALLLAALLSKGQWVTTYLSEPKEYVGSAAIGNKVYFAGGSNSTGYLTKVEVYDIAEGTWTNAGNLIVGRQIIGGTVTCGSRIFFAGGFDWTTTFNNVDIYNTLTGEWTDDQLSVDRLNCAAVSYGSKVMFAGGFRFPSQTLVSTVDIYDTLTETWTTTDLSIAREGIAAAVIGDRAFFSGGVTYSGMVNTVDIYNFTSGTWEQATLSQARSHASATTVGNKLIVAGGATNYNIPSDVVDIYDASTGTWSTASLFEARAAINNAATVNGKAYFVGGGNFMGSGFYAPTDVVDIYDPVSGFWSLIGLPEPIIHHSVVGAGYYLVSAGGKNGQGQLVSDVHILDLGSGLSPANRKEFAFNVYPNPGCGKFNVMIPARLPHNSLIVSVSTLQGSELFTRALAPGESEFEIDLPHGVYLMRVVLEGHIHTRLITII